MGEDAFGFGSDPFAVVVSGGSRSRSMDEFHRKDTKSVNSSGTASTRSSTSTNNGSRSGGTSSSSRDDRRRGVRKSKSGESGRVFSGSGDPFGFDDTPAVAPAPAAPPQRTRARRRASIGVPASMPPQLAPAPTSADGDIQNHFDRSGDRRNRSGFMDNDVQSTASGQRDRRGGNPRRNRRASLASGRPMATSTRSFDQPTKNAGFDTNFNNAFSSGGGGNSGADDYGYEPQAQDYGYEDHAPNNLDYGYEDHTPSRDNNDLGFGTFSTSFSAFDNDFGNTPSSGGKDSRRSTVNKTASSREQLSIKTPKRSSLGVLPTTNFTPAEPKPVIEETSFDFDLSMPAATPSAAASRTQNIMLPTMSAPEKAPRQRRRASLMGNLADTMTAVGGSTLNAMGGTLNAVGGVALNAVGGVVTGKGGGTGEKLDDDKKPSRNNKSSSSSSKRERRKSNDAGTGVGISAYDADRDRRRMFG